MRQMLASRSGDSAAVCEAVGRWLEERPDLQRIAVYAAMPGEVDLGGLVAARAGIAWLFPRVCGDELRFHQVRSLERDLATGAFGIFEPLEELADTPTVEIDAFLCPGLAFDERGGRLGRGRGFYDRLLAGARPGAAKVGVCFPYQIVADTFAEPHDVRMDLVIR